MSEVPRASGGTVGDLDAAVAALFARQPDRMVPDLDRITTLVELLGRPDLGYPAIHLTGTNGKTSTANMITCLLGALGLAAGGYTSPHLQDVRERIRVATEPISREALATTLAYLEPFLAEVDARHPSRVSFFEVLTAAAFVHFADAPIDVGVFEVGLGGRWDATNTIAAQVAVLTSIALDHPELGSTPAQVAEEKSGIIKDGAVVVSGVEQPDAVEVIRQAAQRRAAPVVRLGTDFAVEERVRAVGGQLITLRGVTGTIEEIHLPLFGAHQARNAACALAAVEGFLGFAGGIDADVVRTGFAAVSSPGRLEVVPQAGGPPVILDGAHNPAGVAALARALTEEFRFRHRVVVLGVLGDKDVESMVHALLPVTDHLIVCPVPSARSAPAQRLVEAASGVTVEVAEDVAGAIELARGLATEADAVVVTGSLYVVGAARTALGLPPA